MNIILKFILLFLFCINAFSQKQFDNENCTFVNKELIIYSYEITDTIYVKVYAKHYISQQFEKADGLRISFKNINDDEFSESIDINNNYTKNDDMAYLIHKIIQKCHNEYSKVIYEEQIDRIEELKQIGSNIYIHYVFVKIYPK